MNKHSISVGPRASKEDFMAAIGLEANNSYHEQYYRLMRDETIAIYNVLNSDKSFLIDNVQGETDSKAPFFWHHIRPDCRKWAIKEVWRRSSPITRPLFDRGASSNEHGPNWVIGWLLYSVFRSRDIRNSRNRRKTLSNGGINKRSRMRHSSCSSAILSPPSMSSSMTSSSPTDTSSGVPKLLAANRPVERRNTTTFYDPVRNWVLQY